MRKVGGFIGVFALTALGAGFVLQGTASAQEMVYGSMGQAPEAPMAVQGQTSGEVWSADDGCSDCGGQCECCGRQGCIARYRGKWAAVGSANCSCQGSYKYPVPPQYTYHWPGMYSAQTMTQYASPYRFPPLKLPPSAQAQGPSGLNVGPADSKPVSTASYTQR